MQVELINNGGYSSSINQCVGKVFDAVVHKDKGTMSITMVQLVAAGYNGDASGCSTELYFHDCDIRPLDP